MAPPCPVKYEVHFLQNSAEVELIYEYEFSSCSYQFFIKIESVNNLGSQ